MFFGSKQLVGLDLGRSSIKMIELKTSGRSLHIKNFGMSPIPEGLIEGGEIMDPPVLGQTIAALHRDLGLRTKAVCTGIFGVAVIVKKISIPKTDPKLIPEQIQWEAEQYIPFDLSEVNLEYHLLPHSKSSKENMDILLVAAKHNYIINYFEAVEAADLRCSLIDVNGFALANCFEINYGLRRGEVIALVNIGSAVTNVVLIDNGSVVFCRDIPMGGNLYNMEISRELGISMQEAEELKIGFGQSASNPEELSNLVTATNQMICEEIKNSFDFYNQAQNGKQIDEIFISGGSSKVPHILEAISSATGVSCQFMNPLQKVSYNKNQFSAGSVSELSPFLPLAIGLGMRQVGDS